VPTKLDLWQDLVDKLGIDMTRPVSYVTAKEIEDTTLRQTRLMVSMDSEKSRPDVFRKNGSFVLALSRSRFAIVRGEGYHELEDPGEPVRFEARLPLDLTSLAYGRGESRYLLHAYHGGLLSHFSGVPQMFQTVLGKQATGKFLFRVDGSPELEANRAGMEVDMGFEAPDDLLLFEAKASARDTFLIRQLYYPFRTFREVTPKHVRSFFFVAEPDENIYTIWEYEWPDDKSDDYEAIRLKKATRFLISEARPPVDALAGVAPDSSLAKIPQADDLEKVAEFPFRVLQGVSSTHQWARLKGIADRQGQYYREAAEALGLVRMEGRMLKLTEDGKRLVRLPPPERGDFLARRILRNPVMNEVFHVALSRRASGLSDSDVAGIVRRLSQLSGSTPLRRAQTVRSYFTWLAKTTGTVVVDGRRIYSREAWDARGRTR
jgi:hypothetical protein